VAMRTFFITYQDIAKTESLILSTRITNYLVLAGLKDLAPLNHFLLKGNSFSIGKIKREEYQEKGEFPVIDQSKDFIVGYSDEDSLVYSGKLPVIVFGDHTRVFKYVDFPFIQGADGIQIIAPDPEAVNPKFFYYLLNHFGVPSRDYNRHFSILKKQRYPVISKNIQDKTISKIEPIEREIERLQGIISDPAEAISRVFAREFGFDLEKFEELKRQKVFLVDLRDFANNHDLRCSVKFHRPAAKFVESELRSRTDKSVKDFLAEDIVLGASVSPDDYDDNGEFYYVAMSSIKNWSFDKESARSVSDEYAGKNQAKLVKETDMIMARSGEGTIGKVALIGDDLQGIFADFTMRIRLKGYDPEFAYYYFRTQYVQYLIETNKKGLGNNTNIFPNQIKEFPMLDVPLTRQKRIVKEIQAEFSAQDKIKRRIEAKRKQIDQIIEQALA
jgi:restriction endonuclease S subunit